MAKHNEDREERRKRKENAKKRGGDGAPEAANLLSPPRSLNEAHANAEPSAASSSPLLVQPETTEEAHNGQIGSPKRRSKPKQRLLSATSSLRIPRSKSKRQDSNAVTASGTGADAKSRKNENDSTPNTNGTHSPPRSHRSLSVWGLFSNCVCIGGSLRLPASSTELAKLSADARAIVASLDSITKQSHLEVFVRHTDNMPFASTSHNSYGRPIVLMHAVDLCTGRPVVRRVHTTSAAFSTRMLNAFEWNSSHVLPGLTLTEFASPQVLLLFEIVEPRRVKHKTFSMHFAPPTTNKAADEQRSTADPIGNLSDPSRYKRLAWCFFKPVSDSGNIRLPSLALPDSDTASDATVRLQLFAWQPLGWLDSHQARSQFRWNPEFEERMPTVFLQFQMRSRVRLPCSLHVELRPVVSASTVLTPRRLSGITEQMSARSLVAEEPGDGGDSKIPQDDSLRGNQEPDQIAVAPEPSARVGSPMDPVLKCQRRSAEPCLVPQRVLHRLPTGRKGCSSLAFSPDGLFLAAAVHQLSSTAEEWVIHIHQVNTGALWQSCRGHQSMIYSLEWSPLGDIGAKALLSSSSDGSAMLWILRETASASLTTLPGQIFQHVPSPVFVYCAMFHAWEPNVVVTGSSDGVVRLWSLGETTELSTQPARSYMAAPIYQWIVNVSGSSVAVHSIRMESKQGGRLFCGDASGTITVWTPATTESGLTYELTKSVRTGQRSVASLALHPRKQHLLVLTHPHALFQYELRSFLLLHKNYVGIECDQLLAKTAFSPDGQFVVSGSEDGVPHLFGAVQGQRLDASSRGVWGHRFFHGFPLLEIAWSPSSHIVAMGAYGQNHPIVMLCATRGDQPPDEGRTGSGIQRVISLDHPLTGSRVRKGDVVHDEMPLASPSPDGAGQRLPRADHRIEGEEESLSSERVQRARQRRQQRLEAKLAREIEAAQTAPPSRAEKNVDARSRTADQRLRDCLNPAGTPE